MISGGGLCNLLVTFCQWNFQNVCFAHKTTRLMIFHTMMLNPRHRLLVGAFGHLEPVIHEECCFTCHQLSFVKLLANRSRKYGCERMGHVGREATKWHPTSQWNQMESRSAICFYRNGLTTGPYLKVLLHGVNITWMNFSSWLTHSDV